MNILKHLRYNNITAIYNFGYATLPFRQVFVYGLGVVFRLYLFINIDLFWVKTIFDVRNHE